MTAEIDHSSSGRSGMMSPLLREKLGHYSVDGKTAADRIIEKAGTLAERQKPAAPEDPLMIKRQQPGDQPVEEDRPGAGVLQGRTTSAYRLT